MTGMPHAAPAYRYIQALLPCTLKLTALGVIPLEPEPLAFLGLVALRVVEEKSLGDVVEGRVGLRLLLRITCLVLPTNPDLTGEVVSRSSPVASDCAPLTSMPKVPLPLPPLDDVALCNFGAGPWPEGRPADIDWFPKDLSLLLSDGLMCAVELLILSRKPEEFAALSVLGVFALCGLCEPIRRPPATQPELLDKSPMPMLCASIDTTPDPPEAETRRDRALIGLDALIFIHSGSRCGEAAGGGKSSASPPKLIT